MFHLRPGGIPKPLFDILSSSSYYNINFYTTNITILRPLSNNNTLNISQPTAMVNQNPGDGATKRKAATEQPGSESATKRPKPEEYASPHVYDTEQC